MKHSWYKWAIRAMMLAMLALCNFLVGCGGCGSSKTAAVSGTTRFAITDLGTMRPTGINNSAQIVGVVDGGDNTARTTRPVFWESGVMTPLQGLNGPADGANAINDLGQIVGHAGGTSATDPTFHAVIWANSKAAPVLLPAPAGTSDLLSDAVALNNNGDVVGSGRDQSIVDHAIAWPHGASSGVILTGPPPADANTVLGNTALWSVNASGQAVGVSLYSPSNILSTVNTFRDLALFNINQPGTAQNLGIVVEVASTVHFPFSVDIPQYMNASGTIVGSMGATGAGFAYIRQPNGQVTQIPTSPDQSAATGINAGGTVILNINPDSIGITPTCGIFDTANGLRDLNTLIPSGSGWQLQFTAGINDKGQIVGSGQFKGSTHGFLLTPTAGGFTPLPISSSN